MTVAEGAEGLRSLRIVIFSAAGVRYGAVADQIDSICDVSPDAEMGNVIRLAAKLECRHDSANGSPLTALKVRGEKAFYLVAVDRIDEVVEIGIDAIRPMPLLILPYARAKGIWGVVPRAGELLLLLDFTKLPEGDSDGGDDVER